MRGHQAALLETGRERELGWNKMAGIEAANWGGKSMRFLTAFMLALVLITTIAVAGERALGPFPAMSATGTRGPLDALPAGARVDSENVDFVGAWPFCIASDVAIDEDRDLAFLASGGGVYILDVSDPANPVELSSGLQTEGWVPGLTYSDGKLYVANYP